MRFLESHGSKLHNLVLLICRLHDFDNNTKLDGLEIYKALTHLLPFEPENEDKYKTTAEHNQGRTKEEIDSIRKDDELQYYTSIYYRILYDYSILYIKE